MRHEDAELQLWLANDRFSREHRELQQVEELHHGSERPTLRQRAGKAVIAFGERLAGDPRRPGKARRYAARPS